MERVKQEEWGRVRRLFQNQMCFVPTFVHSVLDGQIVGEIYSNSHLVENVFVKTNNGLCFVCGEENHDDFNERLIRQFREHKNEHRRFTLFTASEKWEEMIHTRLDDEVKQYSRFSFEYIEEGKSSLPPEEKNEVQRIYSSHIHQALEFGGDYYKEYWGSVTRFLEKGFGFCIVSGGKVVSEGTSIFCSDHFAEIDIATSENFRGKGFATDVAKAFINHSVENGLVPRWDCDGSNASSIRLAEKLGFGNPTTYSVFI
ncbi:GNAT family N-acetyltransferase [Halobacillus locisalis]|uniref:GNAT family N-acetyltransferase n=1 Tax=Halobacillus locisalis TaxID=220753 RepID=A0A838CV80_9BACI|nr:GNAT family N-acetyltransferase [Halobacillus locisalis]MBA2176042.1 GNAT family N-acetyltransferase [Halobacillus locisalis]